MQQLLKTIQSSYSTLPQAQKAVAEYIVGHYQDIPFLSVTSMAKEIGVSDTTIIKYCMQLGFSGFGDFKRTVTEYVQTQSNWHDRLEQHLTEIEDQDVYSKVYHSEIGNIKNTLENSLNRQNYDRLLNSLDQAENIYIMGFRSSSILARFLSFSLGQLGYRTYPITPEAGDYYELACRMTPKDLLISISFSRYMSDAVIIAEAAAKKGVPHVAFADTMLSPVAAHSDYSFICAVESYNNAPSLAGGFVLISTILTGCAQRHPEEAKSYMLQVEEFLGGHGLLYPLQPREH